MAPHGYARKMGTFYVSCVVRNHVDRSRTVRLRKMLVDSGSERTWIPAAKLEAIGVPREKKDLPFVMANGQVVTRSIGFAIVAVGDRLTTDEVVFAEPGDTPILGARTLEGLDLMVDARNKRLVSSGPRPAAAA